MFYIQRKIFMFMLCCLSLCIDGYSTTNIKKMKELVNLTQIKEIVIYYTQLNMDTYAIAQAEEIKRCYKTKVSLNGVDCLYKLIEQFGSLEIDTVKSSHYKLNHRIVIELIMVDNTMITIGTSSRKANITIKSNCYALDNRIFDIIPELLPKLVADEYIKIRAIYKVLGTEDDEELTPPPTESIPDPDFQKELIESMNSQ